jgi:D-xylose transport system permease protein
MGEKKLEKRSAARNINIGKYTMVVALVVLAVVFQAATGGVFLGSRNLSNLFRQMSIIGTVTMGMLLLIISGNIDLAIGSSVAVCGGFAAVLQVWFGQPTWVSVIGALVMGVFISLWQGFWIAYRNVPAFVATLGNQMLFRGLYQIITRGKTVGPVSNTFHTISQSYIPAAGVVVLGVAACAAVVAALFLQRAAKSKFKIKTPGIPLTAVKCLAAIALIGVFCAMMNTYQGIPVPVVIFLAAMLAILFVLSKMRFGRRVYAIGGNPEAAKLSGVNIKRHVLLLYIIIGVQAAIGGLMLVSRLDGAVGTAGLQYETDAISACVIGGASLAGGTGSVMGAIIGSLIIAVLENGMGLLNFPTYYQYVVKGLVLIIAVWFDIFSRKRKVA